MDIKCIKINTSCTKQSLIKKFCKGKNEKVLQENKSCKGKKNMAVKKKKSLVKRFLNNLEIVLGGNFPSENLMGYMKIDDTCKFLEI